MTIWKYPIEVMGTQEVSMPGGARILCVQTQHDRPMLWALVNPEHEREVRTLITVGTGNDFDTTKLHYRGTYQIFDGLEVYHVFEKI